MSGFMEMADSVKEQAVAFLGAEGVSHDAELPEIDEKRTQADLVAAPFAEDRVLAALLILRVHARLSVLKMQLMTNPEAAGDIVDSVGHWMYRLRMYQDAMHGRYLQGRRLSQHSGRSKTRDGSGRWLLARLTSGGRSLDDALKEMAKGDWCSFSDGFSVALLDDKNDFVTGEPIGKHRVVYQHKKKPKSIRVKALREL